MTIPVEDVEAKIARLQLEHRELAEALLDNDLSDEEAKMLKHQKLITKDKLSSLGAVTLPTRKKCRRRAA